MMEDGVFPLDLPRGGEALEPRSSICHPQSSIFCLSAFRHLRGQPFCRAQKARVAMARADELNADG
jgi:hypothetical protein